MKHERSIFDDPDAEAASERRAERTSVRGA
jgi:hypothetical protein